MQWIRSHLSFANTISLIALFVALGGTSLAAVTLTKNSVGAKQIKKNAVQASEIKRNAVGASEIRSNAVAGADIADNSVGGSDLSDNSVGSGELSDNSVGSGEIGDNAVGNSEIGDESVGSSEIADGSVGTGDVAPGVIQPRAFARIDSAGNIVAGQAKNISQSQIVHSNTAPDNTQATATGIGVYCIGGLDFTPSSALVATDNTDAMPAIPGLTGGSLNFIPTVAVAKGEAFGRCPAGFEQVRIAMEQVNDTAAPTLANHGFFVWIYG